VHILSLAEDLAQFLFMWHLYRPELIREGQKVVDFIENSLIKDTDSNHWSRAIIEKEEVDRPVRTTISESFNRSLKRLIPDGADNQIDL
jgi:hypothetical protein